MMEYLQRPAREWIEMQKSGAFDASDFDTMVRAGWVDWFGPVEKLAPLLKKLAPLVRRVAASGRVDLDATYVAFKLALRIDGVMYPMFWFAEIETGQNVFTVVPDAPEGGSSIWDASGEHVFETWHDAVAYLDQ